jgi:hypothetical protein
MTGRRVAVTVLPELAVYVRQWEAEYAALRLTPYPILLLDTALHFPAGWKKR